MATVDRERSSARLAVLQKQAAMTKEANILRLALHPKRALTLAKALGGAFRGSKAVATAAKPAASRGLDIINRMRSAGDAVSSPGMVRMADRLGGLAARNQWVASGMGRVANGAGHVARGARSTWQAVDDIAFKPYIRQMEELGGNVLLHGANAVSKLGGKMGYGRAADAVANRMIGFSPNANMWTGVGLTTAGSLGTGIMARQNAGE